MSSNHFFEFEFPDQIYKTHKQPLNKAWKGEQKIGSEWFIYSWSRSLGLAKRLKIITPVRVFQNAKVSIGDDACKTPLGPWKVSKLSV